MSCTSTYSLFRTKANCISEHRNGHGSGPAIWDYISLKLTGKQFNMFDDKEFWPLWKDSRLSKNERAVLLSTYDRAFVEVSLLTEFATACQEVSNLIIDTTEWTCNHFAAIGVDAANLAERADYRCRGMAIGCTSVCDAWEQEDIREIDAWGVYGLIDELAESS